MTSKNQKGFNPEPLTHIQQEQYTRPHLGSGDSASVERVIHRIRPLKVASTKHHIIESGRARRMTVHAPRIEDMDRNHPKNLKKLEPKREKYNEYKPFPPAAGDFQIVLY